MVPINYLAVVGAAVIAIVLGFLWYGPLFGRAWMKSMGMDMDEMKAKAKGDKKMQMAMMRSYGIMMLSSLVMAFVLAHSLYFASAVLQISGIPAAFQAAVWNWLGFIAPVSLGGVLWESKTWKWWAITSGYYLVSLFLMGSLLSYWV